MSFKLIKSSEDEELDEELEEEDETMEDAREIRKRIRVMRLKKKELELRKSLEGLESEINKPQEDLSDVMTPKIAMELASLPDEERQRVIETYAMLRSAEKSGAGASMIPMLIGYVKANPGASQASMVEFARVMGEQFSKGAETVKAMLPQRERTEDPMRFLELVKDLIKESVQRPIMDAIKQLQPQPSVFEQILLDDKLFNRAKELGVFGRHEPRSGSEIDLEIEKLRGERELQIEKLRLEAKKMMLQHEADERRTESLISAIAPLGTLLAGPIDQKMRQLGRSTSERVRPPASPPPPAGNLVHIRCTCGYRGSIMFEGEPPSSLKCPSCGRELVIGVAPTGESKKADTEDRGGDQGT